jgi:hypothetical protein
LAPEFWVLVESLDDFAKRWAGPTSRAKSKSSLAGRYSAQLRALYQKCTEHPDYSPDVVGYSTDGFVDQTSAQTPQGRGLPRQNDQSENTSVTRPLQTPFDARPPNPGLPFDPTHTQISNDQLNFLPQISPTNPGLEHNSPDELSAISTVLMDQDFMQLDRVISFDDMMFTAQTIDDQGAPFSMNNWTLG